MYLYSFRLQVQTRARHIVLKLRSQQYPVPELLKLLLATEFWKVWYFILIFIKEKNNNMVAGKIFRCGVMTFMWLSACIVMTHSLKTVWWEFYGASALTLFHCICSEFKSLASGFIIQVQADWFLIPVSLLLGPFTISIFSCCSYIKISTTFTSAGKWMVGFHHNISNQLPHFFVLWRNIRINFILLKTQDLEDFRRFLAPVTFSYCVYVLPYLYDWEHRQESPKYWSIQGNDIHSKFYIKRSVSDCSIE
jgi:hypothetical protein